MFGSKVYKETKAKKFASDKERKRYFAIQANYKKKNETTKIIRVSNLKNKKN